MLQRLYGKDVFPSDVLDLYGKGLGSLRCVDGGQGQGRFVCKILYKSIIIVDVHLVVTRFWTFAMPSTTRLGIYIRVDIRNVVTLRPAYTRSANPEGVPHANWQRVNVACVN